MDYDFIKRYPLIVFSACNADFVTFPMDSIKTTMQIKNNNKSFFNTGYNIIRKQGFSSLYRGIQPALFRHSIYTGSRMNLYEKLKSFNVNNNYSYKLATAFLCGGFGQFLATPIDVLKVQMISNREEKINVKDLSKKIYKREGITGFYKGSIPSILRASFLAVGSIGSYDIIKKKIISYRQKEDSFTYLLSSFFGGFNSTLLTTPLDNLKSRMMSDNEKKYKGVFDCLRKSIKANGLRSLYIGFFPTWLRIGPWQLIYWTSYENYRKLCGFSSF